MSDTPRTLYAIRDGILYCQWGKPHPANQSGYMWHNSPCTTTDLNLAKTICKNSGGKVVRFTESLDALDGQSALEERDERITTLERENAELRKDALTQKDKEALRKSFKHVDEL